MIKIDYLDKNILKELSTNSRQPISKIARKLKTSLNKVNYRINNLIKLGIIQEFVTVIDTNKLGYGHYNLNLNLIKVNNDKRKEIINYIKQNFPIIWIGISIGSWDICLDYASKEKNFETLIKNLIDRYGKFIRRYDLIQMKKVFIYPQYPGKLNENYRPLKKEEINDEKITKNEYKTLECIKNKANKSVVDISKETGLSIDIVKYCIKKLTRKKIIMGFNININLSRINYNFYMLRVHLDNFNDDLLNSIVSFCEKYSGLHYIFIDRFSPTIEIDISMRHRKDFNLFLMDLLEEFFKFVVKYDLVILTKSYGTSYLPDNLNISFK